MKTSHYDNNSLAAPEVKRYIVCSICEDTGMINNRVDTSKTKMAKAKLPFKAAAGAARKKSWIRMQTYLENNV